MSPADLPIRCLASGLLLICLAGCNDTRDLAPAAPSTQWQPEVSVDGGPDRPASGERAAGARSAAALPGEPDYRDPAAPGLPVPDPHPAVDPEHQYSLVELVDIAERNNKQTRIAWEQARQAAIEVGISRAAYLPALTLTALGGFRHETTPAEVPQGYVASDTEALFPTLAISYLLVDFGARDAASRAARDTSEAANVSFTLAHQQLILSVARAYFTLGTAEAEFDAAQSALRNAQLLASAAKNQLQQGEGTVTDADITNSETAQARFTIEAASATRSEARDTLLEVLGLPPRTPLRVEPLSDRPVPRDLNRNLDELMHDALRSRPDLLASLARLRASEAETARARAALYPTISLNTKIGGDIGHISVEGIAAHSFDQPEAGIYLDFEWSFYQGGSKANQVRLAESQQAEQRAALEQAEDRDMREVAAAYDELEAGLAQYDAAVTEQQAARTAFNSNAQAFSRGVGTITAAEATANTLDQSNATLARTHAQVLASAATLAFATGQLTSAESLPP